METVVSYPETFWGGHFFLSKALSVCLVRALVQNCQSQLLNWSYPPLAAQHLQKLKFIFINKPGVYTFIHMGWTFCLPRMASPSASTSCFRCTEWSNLCGAGRSISCTESQSTQTLSLRWFYGMQINTDFFHLPIGCRVTVWKST